MYTGVVDSRKGWLMALIGDNFVTNIEAMVANVHKDNYGMISLYW